MRRSRDDNTANELSLKQENQLVAMTTNPRREVHLIPFSQKTLNFKDINSLNPTSLNKNNETSITYIIQITSQQQKEGHAKLRTINTVGNHIEEETFNLGSNSTNQYIIILNINKKQQIFLDSTQNKTQFTVSTLSKLTSSFSTVLREDVYLQPARNLPVRIDGWSADKLPFYDASSGLSIGQSGMYIAPSNGFYYITVNLIVKKLSQRYQII